MDTNELLPALNLFTLIGVLAIVVIAFLLFQRKRSNRHGMKDSPDGAIAVVKTEDGGEKRV